MAQSFLTVAAENGCDLFFEASVAGGIPIIRTTRRRTFHPIGLIK